MGMDPATMMAMGMAGSSGMSALSSINEGIQAKKVAKYQAKQTKADARAAMGAAQLEATKIRQAATQAQGQAVAAVANSGVVVGEGSAGLIEKSIRQRAEQDALITLNDGQDALRRGYLQAKEYKKQGEDAFYKGITNSLLPMASAGVTTAGLVSKWFKGDGNAGAK